MATEEKEESTKKVWTDEERTELATKLDEQLGDFLNNLEKKSYSDGWAQDRWQEEMEKHPFFMTKAPEPGDEVHPLYEGLQQLKYDETLNTPEELALKYKDDGNYNFKLKLYKFAIINYTEGIKTECSEDLLAQLYNNRAAAHYKLKNYRSCLYDCKKALKLKVHYPKAMNRAAACCLEIQEYDQCIEYCNEILKESPDDKDIIRIKLQAIKQWKRFQRDARARDAQKRKTEEIDRITLNAIRDNHINLELPKGEDNFDLLNLEPREPELENHRVHMDENNRLIWPVIFRYPETRVADFVQEFHEDVKLIDQLKELFQVAPAWDRQGRYVADELNVYFEASDESKFYRVNPQQTLGETLCYEKYIVRGGVPNFYVFVADSEAEKQYLNSRG